MNTAMIWGAGGGIGRALVQKVKAAGWRVIAFTRKPEDAAGLADVVINVDVADPRAVEQAVYHAAMEVDDVSLWMYAVGDILSAKTAAMAPGDWDRILASNLTGAYHAVHYSLPMLTEDAQVVLVGAVSERLQLPGLSAYAAAKAGLEAFAAALGKEERKKRILVVRPGAVKTTLWEKVPMTMPKNAMLPGELADLVLKACEEGKKGTLDL